MKGFLKKAAIVLLFVLVIMQFFKPEKNIAASASTHHIRTVYQVPNDVEKILAKACYDCHSNHTNYPWYSNIQPIAWWLTNHVTDGKKHLNFDEFGTYRIAKQNHKLEEVVTEVQESEMPLTSYTLIHGNSKLTDVEKNLLYQWVETVKDTIKSKYPADSLVLPKKKK
ncbi:MAG: heme-binding domain-containing protein [Chitinophagaceae bacterium]